MGPLRLTQGVLVVCLGNSVGTIFQPPPRTSEYRRQGLGLDLEGGREAPWLTLLEERLLTLFSLILEATLQGTEVFITSLIRGKLIFCEVASASHPVRRSLVASVSLSFVTVAVCPRQGSFMKKRFVLSQGSPDYWGYKYTQLHSSL